MSGFWLKYPIKILRQLPHDTFSLRTCIALGKAKEPCTSNLVLFDQKSVTIHWRFATAEITELLSDDKHILQNPSDWVRADHGK